MLESLLYSYTFCSLIFWIVLALTFEMLYAFVIFIYFIFLNVYM